MNANVDQSAGQDRASGSGPSPRPRFSCFRASFLLTFVILFVLWIVLSGRFDPFHLTMGFVACTIVSLFCRDFLFTTRNPSAGSLFRIWLRLLGYIPWLVYQIFLANIHVMYLVFHPRMMTLIDPHLIEFDSRLKSDYARTAFANSITLTPGTITVNVNVLGRFSVHCIDTQSGKALPGEMEARIAKVFDE